MTSVNPWAPLSLTRSPAVIKLNVSRGTSDCCFAYKSVLSKILARVRPKSNGWSSKPFLPFIWAGSWALYSAKDHTPSLRLVRRLQPLLVHLTDPLLRPRAVLGESVPWGWWKIPRGLYDECSKEMIKLWPFPCTWTFLEKYWFSIILLTTGMNLSLWNLHRSVTDI